jgi:multidrug efflux pump subunit AcrA (membrane-fusion protein)
VLASLRLPLAARRGVLAVPIGAVPDIDQHPQVLVVDADNKLRRRSISVGLQTTSE